MQWSESLERVRVMRSRHVFAVLVVASIVAGCVSAEDDPSADGTWAGTITTEGNVTTVINESGSVWGGMATLVEEASIGVLDGDDPYVFSQVRAVVANDERIFVIDALERIVRVYDMEGAHLFDIGRPGDGPGEFRRPWAIGLSLEPRVLVRDLGQRRLHVFSLDGELLDDWPAGGGGPTTIADEGFVYAYNRLSTDAGDAPIEFGMVAMRPDGAGEHVPIPPFEHQRALVPVDRRFIEVGMMQAINQGLPFSVADVPFAPEPKWALASDGTMISGESDAYRFAVERLDGRAVNVERAVDPVPVGGEEWRWYRDRLTRFWREVVPEFVWEGEMPAAKPAFTALTPDRDGRVWVLRQLAGVRLAECDPEPDEFSGFLEQPCWHQPLALEAFGADGRYLGRVDVPEGTRLDVPPFIDGATVIVAIEDEAGTIMVKRYRLVLPGER